MKKKAFALFLALALVVGGVVGGTVAWLTATSDTVTNTFTVGDINIELTETWNTDANNDGDKDSWTAKAVPGVEYAKDPKVTVKAGSEACWLFVKISEENNTMTVNDETVRIADFAIANGWTAVADHAGYYYREVTASDKDQPFYVFAGKGDENLANGYVKINENVTKGQITTANQPTITITAAAVQQEGVSETDAWSKLPADFIR